MSAKTAKLYAAGLFLLALALLYLIVTQASMPTNVLAAIGLAALALFGIGVLVGFVALIFAVARAHQFGFLKGFAALLIGAIVFSLLVNVLGI